MKWLALVGSAFFLVACGSTPPIADVPKADMDVAIDTGGSAMLYSGTARIPRSFNSATPFEIELDGVKAWGSPPANEASRLVVELLGKQLPNGTYYPLGERGKITTGNGRLELRGEILEDGKKLDGDWYFDGQLGGSFQIAQDGFIFP
jgi:hypothetical protein